MPSYSETQYFPYNCQQLYDLVADVEKYPEFLPWCRATRILERHDDHFVAEMVISFKHVTESYVSKVVTTPHSRIDVELLKGPFKHLNNHWEFQPAEGGCTIDFSVDFAFKMSFLEKLIGPLFARASEKMVTAFSDRATELYS